MSGPVLHLVRHGRSTWNDRHLVQGQADDAELTDLGRAQARSVADLLRDVPVVRLLTSDLRRAMQTADIVGDVLGLRPIRTALLREQAQGVLEGLPTARAAEQWEQMAAEAVDEYGDRLPLADFRPTGGESMRDVLARVQALLALPWITESDGDVVLVTHGDTLRVLLALLLGDDPDEPVWREIANGELHSVSRDAGGAVVHARSGG